MQTNGEAPVKTAQWKFETPSTTIYLTKEAAIRYVTEEKNAATDPVIKQNASKTLVALQRVRRADKTTDSHQ